MPVAAYRQGGQHDVEDGVRGDDAMGETGETGDEPRRARANRAEQAFNRYCEGARPAEIAADLGVTTATVRRWLRDHLRALGAENQQERADQLMRAIQGQWAVANEAWRAYRDEQEQTGEHDPRLLALASSAEREAARLQETYDRIQPAISRVEFVVTRRPEGPENVPPATARERREQPEDTADTANTANTADTAGEDAAGEGDGGYADGAAG